MRHTAGARIVESATREAGERRRRLRRVVVAEPPPYDPSTLQAIRERGRDPEPLEALLRDLAAAWKGKALPGLNHEAVEHLGRVLYRYFQPRERA